MKKNNIFILAGGLTDNGENNLWVLERLKKALSIDGSNNYYCIGGGTYHKPQLLDISGYVIYESNKMVEFLLDNNIEKKYIKNEWSSYDTIGNGFFSFINFIIPLKLNNIIVITSKFHMKRVKIIYNYFNDIFNTNINITYIESINNMDRELLSIRCSREEISNENFIKITQQITNIEEFFKWFYTGHDCYNSKKNIPSVHGNILSSY